MGALHDVNATYYSGVGASAASLASGHPDDKVGWVIGGGIKLNAPFFGVGDYFQAQVNTPGRSAVRLPDRAAELVHTIPATAQDTASLLTLCITAS